MGHNIVRSHVDSELGPISVSRPGPEWIARPERSNAHLIRFIVWVAVTLGRPAARALLYPIALYFLVFSSLARKASTDFLSRVLGSRPTAAESFRHFHTFAATILDRVFLFKGQFSRFEVRIHGTEIVEDMVARGEGCFLLGAHLGSFEIVRALGRASADTPVAGRSAPRVSMLMYEENARKVTSVLDAINPELSREVITLGRLDSMLRVRAALERGGFVGMLGDRTIEGEGTAQCDFFGEQAAFATGPFRIATILKRPIVLMFGIYRGGNRYDVHFERLVDMKGIDNAQRDAHIGQSMQHYAARLEHYCRIAPYNWFNFYDFWI